MIEIQLPCSIEGGGQLPNFRSLYCNSDVDSLILLKLVPVQCFITSHPVHDKCLSSKGQRSR